MTAARRLFLAVLTALVLLVPTASAADRMWIGFHDDPTLRFDGGRAEAFGRAAGSGATIVRGLVEWQRVAPLKPAKPTDPFDPAYNFNDIDEFVRNAQLNGMEVILTLWGTPGWANGNQRPQLVPKKMADFQNFAKAISSRYSGRFAGFPYVRFYGIWNESNLATFLSPQYDINGNIVSPRNYAKLAASGYAGIKAGNPTALVAIGETSSNGRDKIVSGQTDTVRPGTFMKLVAKANPRLKFDAWAQHPYPFPVAQAPGQKTKYPNVTFSTLPQFEKELDAAFKRKNIPIWITEYGNETKPGEPKGVSEAQQSVYLSQAIGFARKDPRIQMFVWFVLEDSAGNPWQSGLYRKGGAPKPASAKFAAIAPGLSMVHGKLALKGGTRNPLVKVYVRSFCSNNPVGTGVGTTSRTTLNGKLVQVDQAELPLLIDCSINLRVNGLTVAKGKTYVLSVQANTIAMGQLGRTITIVGT